ncbi:hypothetical protein P9265_22025 [Schinkia azotoformans]|uniref:hypothetical protein n=1 Tax=Schinkia azotoformans TaxID=1454 RepID=UPI002E201A10|nr:hypothetical protein [Schinkia azotoformans]
MDLNALVELVYQEIVQKVESKQPSACIISDTQEKELEQILGDSYQLHYFSEENRKKDYEITVIPRLTVTMLSNLANGIGSTVEEQFVLSQLLQGKKVVILQNGVEYYRYKSSSPVLLYKLYEELERKVKGYGVLFLRNDELLGKKEMPAIEVPVAAEVRMEVNTPPSPSFKLSKKLISEIDLQKLYLQNIKDITVGGGCIITPLAQDFIRTHQLTIIRERGNS